MKATAELRRRILGRRASITVIGQGYVGLSLACAAAEAGFVVTGVDIDERRIAGLADGAALVPGVSEDLVLDAVSSGRLAFATTADAVASADLVFICVPTPVRDGAPDLSYIERACRDVAVRLSQGTLVVLESTTYPGTTEDMTRPLAETSSSRTRPNGSTLGTRSSGSARSRGSSAASTPSRPAWRRSCTNSSSTR